MLLRLNKSIEKNLIPKITKYANGEDASVKGAFSLDTLLTFSVECPRQLGVSAVVLRIHKDGEDSKDISLEFTSSHLGSDTYTVNI